MTVFVRTVLLLHKDLANSNAITAFLLKPFVTSCTHRHARTTTTLIPTFLRLAAGLAGSRGACFVPFFGHGDLPGCLSNRHRPIETRVTFADYCSCWHNCLAHLGARPDTRHLRALLYLLNCILLIHFLWLVGKGL